MKKFFFLFGISIILVGLLAGCKDVADVKKQASPTFPLERTVTDSKGRSLAATFLAKNGNKMALRRSSDRKEFVLALENLSEADRSFLEALPDSDPEKVTAIEKKLAKETRLAGRHASWHKDIENAKREAMKLNLPICLFFARSIGETNKLFERDVLNSTQFRQWAGQNAVLCLYYKNSGENSKSAGLDGISEREARDLASYYNAGGSPTLVILNPDGTKRDFISGYNRSTTQSYIKLIEQKL